MIHLLDIIMVGNVSARLRTKRHPLSEVGLQDILKMVIPFSSHTSLTSVTVGRREGIVKERITW